MKKVATKWKVRAKQDRSNREQIRQSQIKILEDMSKEEHNPASCKTVVSGSVFHPAISHINCDENISKETVNAINKMVDCVIKNDIKNEK